MSDNVAGSSPVRKQVYGLIVDGEGTDFH